MDDSNFLDPGDKMNGELVWTIQNLGVMIQLKKG